MVFPIINPFDLFGGKIKAGGDVTTVRQKSTSLREGSGQSNVVGGFSLFGGADTQVSTTSQSSIINEGDTITNIIGSSGVDLSGAFKRTTETSQTTTPKQSIEKPISIAPAVFGGGTTTATGEAEASSGINPVAIAGVAGLAFLGYMFLKPKKKGGKK